MTFCYFFLSPLVYVLGCGKLWFMFFCLRYTLEERSFGASQVAQMVKNLPAMQEIRVQSLGREDHLEKGMETHSSILAWRIPWSEEPGRLQSMGSQRVGHNLSTNHPDIAACSGRAGHRRLPFSYGRKVIYLSVSIYPVFCFYLSISAVSVIYYLFIHHLSNINTYLYII